MAAPGISIFFFLVVLLVLGALIALVVGIILLARTKSQPEPPPLRARRALRWCPECRAELPPDAPGGLCPRCLLQRGFESVLNLVPKAAVPAHQVAPPPAENQPAASPSGTAAYHGPVTVPTPADLAPHFPHLEILELLGQGGMGAVYKARQPKLDRLVAIKILPPEWSRDPAFAERFVREARALAKLNHPNIVAIHDFGEAGGYFYFLMEYVDGANLRQIMQSGQMNPARAGKLIPQICEALQYAHDEGIVHRDIKPENILVDRRGRVKIADFGLAKLVHPTPAGYTLTGTHQVMGTLHYMAPEQVEKPHLVDHRADIYSLGVVVYEMLTGELPLGRFDPPSRKAPVDDRWDEVVLRALAKEPERRYQQVSEVKTDMESIAGGGRAVPGGVATPPAHAGDPFALEDARDQVRAPATGLLLVGLLGALVTGIVLMVAFAKEGFDDDIIPFFVMFLWHAAVGALLIMASVKMRELEAYELCIVATGLGMVPCHFTALLGIPLGIWALIVLCRPGVRLAFAEASRRRRHLRAQLAAQGIPLAAVEQQLQGPSLGLILAGAAAPVAWFVVGMADGRDRDVVRMFIVMFPLALLIGGLLIAGALQMRRLATYELCVIASVVAMLPLPPHFFGYVLSLPMGIWAFWILRKPEVRAAFERKARGGAVLTPPPESPPHAILTVPLPPAAAPPTGPLRRKLRSMWQAARSLFIRSRATDQTIPGQHWE